MKAVISNENLTKPIPELWRNHIEGWKNSGLLKTEYCKKHQLNYTRLMYWQKKINAIKEQPLIPVAVKNIQRKEQSNVLCSIKLNNGLLLKIYDVLALENVLTRLNVI